MRILRNTKIEDMIKGFAPFCGTITSVEPQIEVSFGEYPHKAVFGARTRRSVWDTKVHRKTLEVTPCFMDADFPEPVAVGDKIACLYTQVGNEPAVISNWTPWWVYEQHLQRMKAKWAQEDVPVYVRYTLLIETDLHEVCIPHCPVKLDEMFGWWFTGNVAFGAQILEVSEIRV